MQSAGNEFVFLDAFSRPLPFGAEAARKLADRGDGIGCDQVLVLSPPDTGPHVISGSERRLDVICQIYNADGSIAEQCGNGIACTAVYLRDKGLCTFRSVRARVGGRVLSLQVLGRDRARVDMGQPVFEPQQVPVQFSERQPFYPIDVLGETQRIAAVSMGNPHAVLQVPDVDQVEVAQLGTAIQGMALFPQGVNVGFMEIRDRCSLRLRVFERGVGETPSCGSGACAATVVAGTWGHVEERVTVVMPGGTLSVAWCGCGHPVSLEVVVGTLSEGVVEL